MSDHKIDTSRRRFLVSATGVVGGIGAAFVAYPFLSAWSPSAKAIAAGAPVNVDISKVEEGQQITVEWRGQPVWVLNRTKADLENMATQEHLDKLRDPDSMVASQQPSYAQNATRSVKPEYLVVVGICTHLGCVPLYKPEPGLYGADWKGGYFCPCHGSMYDLAGRVYKDVPAPMNLPVPPYHYSDDGTLVVGEDPQQV